MFLLMRLAIGVTGVIGLLLAPGRPVSSDPDPTTTPAPAAPPETYYLRVTADRLNLRSRPDQNSVAVAQVERDAVLEGLGSEFGWHRVIPPDGVFSYVSARYVRPTGSDEGVVAVESGRLRVRVGSRLVDLDPLRSEAQTLLAAGTKVRIVGRHGDWYKIAVPEGVYVYVSDRYVERILPEVAARLMTASEHVKMWERANGEAGDVGTVAVASPSAERRSDQATEPRSDGTGVSPVHPDGPGPPGDEALSGPWGQRLRRAEAAIEAEADRPVPEQAWSDPIALLQPIAEQRAEPVVARLAQEWLARLEQRLADQAAFREAERIAQQEQRGRERFERELQRLRQARDELAGEQRYAARGQLLPSLALRAEDSTGSVSEGPAAQAAWYKLEDPLSGRLVAYLEPAPDARIRMEAFVGRYVGVLGERRYDEELAAYVIHAHQIYVLKPQGAASQPARQRP